jgi:hypothetical protein
VPPYAVVVSQVAGRRPSLALGEKGGGVLRRVRVRARGSSLLLLLLWICSGGRDELSFAVRGPPQVCGGLAARGEGCLLFESRALDSSGLGLFYGGILGIKYMGIGI